MYGYIYKIYLFINHLNTVYKLEIELRFVTYTIPKF